MHDDRTSDEQLMNRYADGDHTAGALIFRRYARQLVCMLRERGASDADAQELVQQGFLKLHRARARYQRGRRLRPWLVTIVFNLRRDELRSARRWREKPLECDVLAPELPDRLVAESDQRRVRSALDTLSSGQRELIEMHWFEELSYPEIANRVGASPGAVKLRAFRAHAALRHVLNQAA